MMGGVNDEPAPLTPDAVRLDGRVVVVTGAANGIGRATAVAAAAFGASVSVCDKKASGKNGGWVWEVTVPGGDATPLESMCFATYAAKTTKRVPGRTAKVRVMR